MYMYFKTEPVLLHRERVIHEIPKRDFMPGGRLMYMYFKTEPVLLHRERVIHEISKKGFHAWRATNVHVL
jgi:hypothetical protein